MNQSIYKSLKVGILTLGISVSALPLAAQQLRTAYFMDKSTVRTAMNPALRPERGYIAIPGLGSVYASYGSGSLAISDIFYPRGNKLVTFMDPSVSTDQFLSKLKNNNRINTDFSLGILGAGWYSGSNFWTIDIALKASVNTNIPKSLFEFIKRGSGLNGTAYDVKDLKVSSNAYVETALGFSRPVNSRLTLGGKLKVLAGGANANVYFDKMHIEMTDQNWKITSKGNMDVSMQGLSPKFSTDDQDLEYIDDFEYNTPGVAGMGGAIDLGASYKLLPNLTLSASVIDLGFINWSKSSTISGKATGDFFFDGFDIPIGDQQSPEGSISDQMESLTDGMQELMHFRPTTSKNRSSMLGSTINVAGEYAILDNQISFGILSSTHVFIPRPYSELTISANFRPTHWFSATLSYSAISSDFNTFGVALNFSPSWINFFVGTDYMLTRVTPQWVPINARAANIFFGMSVPLGKQRQKWYQNGDYRY